MQFVNPENVQPTRKIKQATPSFHPAALFIDPLSQHLTHSHHMTADVFLTGAYETFFFCVAVTCQKSIAAGRRPLSFI